ncbi:hypothetical protein ASPWEDRAFT_175238 [Aspergillus wentii DTO 134E9]|uniref:Uncharacterized protein n=1 Tax=Aspergillus wentii DTO 134E9 TaxID=1073089 RepID=A0A1L9RAG2_ASPWE|nr:uncharacterized protein ASPWEDRAFT_175238 [Aspergillus wentii DTO 134E9]KAI9934510.1 hypothetical protein MW887_000124 [Aspergillus wentii]OJJ31925.1 hypothetical protein ASPWEDRAFT_175238 [Aspergillus wentii DTO 134E9]
MKLAFSLFALAGIQSAFADCRADREAVVPYIGEKLDSDVFDLVNSTTFQFLTPDNTEADIEVHEDNPVLTFDVDFDKTILMVYCF